MADDCSHFSKEQLIFLSVQGKSSAPEDCTNLPLSLDHTDFLPDHQTCQALILCETYCELPHPFPPQIRSHMQAHPSLPPPQSVLDRTLHRHQPLPMRPMTAHVYQNSDEGYGLIPSRRHHTRHVLIHTASLKSSLPADLAFPECH